MKALLIASLLIIAFSCKSPAPVIVPVRTTTTVQARPVQVRFQPDSLALSALFRCDSNNRVILDDYSELFSKYMNLNTTFQQQADGSMKANINAKAQKPDTLFIVRDTTITQEVPVYVPTPTKKPLTWLQRTLIYSGIAFWVFVFIYVLTRFYNPFKF